MYFSRLTIVALALLLGNASGLTNPHPTRLSEGASCLECHAAKAAAAHVHPATKKGCGICHAVENRGEETYVQLRQPSPALCFECHHDAVFTSDPHFSYSPGACLGCHDPHGSNDPSLMRASINDLCLRCHLRGKESASSTYLPTISLAKDNSVGHPFAAHPVKGKKNPLTGDEMSCVSCHLAHGGARRFHLKVGAQIPEDALNQNVETKDMCNKCHQAMWGLDGGVGKKSKRKGK